MTGIKRTYHKKGVLKAEWFEINGRKNGNFTARSILNDTNLFFINFRFTMKSRFHFIIFLFSLFQRSIKIIYIYLFIY